MSRTEVNLQLKFFIQLRQGEYISKFMELAKFGLSLIDTL